MKPEMGASATELGERYGYSLPVARLLSLGVPVGGDPSEWATAEELGLGAEDTPELIRLLLDERWDSAESDAPEALAAIHAWRVLGDLRAVEAVPALIAFLKRYDDDVYDWATSEIPIVLGMIGPAAIPALKDYVEACLAYTPSCGSAAAALTEVGRRHPEARDRCVEILTAKLERHREQDPTLNGFLIGALIDLGAVESEPAIRAALVAGAVDLAIAGDLEDVQIELGLRAERSLPSADREGGSVAARGTTAEGATPRKARADKKSKRKQADETRKKARRRKKG